MINRFSALCSSCGPRRIRFSGEKGGNGTAWHETFLRKRESAIRVSPILRWDDANDALWIRLYEFEFIRETVTNATPFPHSHPRFNQRRLSPPLPLHEATESPWKSLQKIYSTCTCTRKLISWRWMSSERNILRSRPLWSAVLWLKLELPHQMSIRLPVYRKVPSMFKAKGVSSRIVCVWIRDKWISLITSLDMDRLWIMIKTIKGQSLSRQVSLTWRAKNPRRSRQPDSSR